MELLNMFRTGLGSDSRGRIPLEEDVRRFLTHYDCPGTLAHCASVTVEARQLAVRYSSDAFRAEQASWLHDVSAVVPCSDRLSLAHELQLDILVEESALPMILHQKLSAVFARELFGIRDGEVLSAIACHTTLKPDASPLDKVVFLADKIAWDGDGRPPYLDDVLSGLTYSLDAGVCAYFDYLWQQREILPVVHPWFLAARRQLCGVEGSWTI